MSENVNLLSFINYMCRNDKIVSSFDAGHLSFLAFESDQNCIHLLCTTYLHVINVLVLLFGGAHTILSCFVCCELWRSLKISNWQQLNRLLDFLVFLCCFFFSSFFTSSEKVKVWRVSAFDWTKQDNCLFTKLIIAMKWETEKRTSKTKAIAYQCFYRSHRETESERQQTTEADRKEKIIYATVSKCPVIVR